VGSNSARQQTAAKRAREATLRERREQKLAKKHAASEARRSAATDPSPTPPEHDDTGHSG